MVGSYGAVAHGGGAAAVGLGDAGEEPGYTHKHTHTHTHAHTHTHTHTHTNTYTHEHTRLIQLSLGNFWPNIG